MFVVRVTHFKEVQHIFLCVRGSSACRLKNSALLTYETLFFKAPLAAKNPERNLTLGFHSDAFYASFNQTYRCSRRNRLSVTTDTV